MAKLHGKAFDLEVNAVDISTATRKFGLAISVDTAEVTNAASGGSKEYLEGNSDATMSADGPCDFGAGLQDATVFALIGAGADTVHILGDGGSAIAAGNPEYQQSGILTGYNIDFDITKDISWSASWQRSGGTTRDVVA